MKINAAQLAQIVTGTVDGDPEATVHRPEKIEYAKAGDFAFLDNPRYESFAYTTQASVLLVHRSFKATQPVTPTLIRVDDVRVALAVLLQHFETAQHNGSAAVNSSETAVVHPQATVGIGTSIGHYSVVEEGAVIGNNCIIYPQVYIGRNARIGDNCRLYPGARIHFDCIVGNDCIIHANAVIGADGFGYAPQEDKTWKKVPQVGNVVIEDDVEIGACTCIDRAALGSTTIRKGAKLDNLIHIAHNVEVGRNSVFAAQVGVAGSTRIGDNCQVGGQAGFSGHIHIADGTRIQAQSGLPSTIKEENTAVFGSPAIGYKDYIKSYSVFKQLPELQRQVAALEKKLRQLSEGEQP